MCTSPITIRNGVDAFEKGHSMYMTIPCGKCPDCIKNKVSDWTQRTKKEIQAFLPFYSRFRGYFDRTDVPSSVRSQFNYPPKTENDFSFFDQSNEVWFFTFTYDDDHLPEPILSPLRLSTRIARPRNWQDPFSLLHPYNDPRPLRCRPSRERIPSVTTRHSFRLHPLNFKDVTEVLHTFNKYRSRRGLNPFSYLLCGEYGSHTHRPHYHALIIGISRTDAYRLARMWQNSFCPSSLEYSTNPLDRAQDDTLWDTPSNLYCSEAMSAMEYRHQFNKIGVLFRIVDLSDVSASGRCAGYIAKYIVKGGDDWSKRYPNLPKPRASTSKGYGLGYHFSKPSGRDSQIDARETRREYLKGVYYPQNVEKYTKTAWNIDFLHIFAENLVETENGYKKRCPRNLRDFLLPLPRAVTGTNKVGDSFTRRTYHLYYENLPKSYDLRDALSAYNLQEGNRKYLDSFRNWLHDERCFSCPLAFHIYVRGMVREQRFQSIDKSAFYRRNRRELAGADQF